MRELRFLALTQPVEGREEEFNEWYETEHVPAFLALPGFRSAQRYKFAGQGPGSTPPGEYLAVYEVDGPVEQARAGLARAAESGQIAMSDLFAPGRLATWWFAPVAPEDRT